MPEAGYKVIYKCQGHVVADDERFVDLELDENISPMLVSVGSYGLLGSLSNGIVDEMYKEICRLMTRENIDLCESLVIKRSDKYIDDYIELVPRFKVVIEKLESKNWKKSLLMIWKALT